MIIITRPFLFFVLALLLLGCSHEEFEDGEINKRSHYPIILNDSLRFMGARNAVKKAYQMTDIRFVPKADIAANSKIYHQGQTYKGMIYSSTKEINTYVGEDISFYTFMTAMNNPRSKLYTEIIGQAPYHGSNCNAYYGTVCSGLVSYALGLKENFRSYDFRSSDKMYEIYKPCSDSIQVADVIWQPGHVVLVTDVSKQPDGKVTNVEIAESTSGGTYRRILGKENIRDYFLNGKKLLRYLELEKNTNYIPCNQFVAVGDEVLEPFVYNDLICPDKGDKSCYRTDEDVILNLARKDGILEVYRDEVLIETISSGNDMDFCLKGLDAGDYKARVYFDGKASDFVYWKVLETHVSIDYNTNRVYFGSINAKPVYFEFCNISGFRPEDYGGVYTHPFTDEDLRKGYIDVTPPSSSPDKKKRTYEYVKIHFECEYGRIVNAPLRWERN